MRYDGLPSWISMDYHGLSWITTYAPQASDDMSKVWRRYGAYRSLHWCRRLSQIIVHIIMEYHGLRTMMDYGLSWIIADYHFLAKLLWIVVDYGLSWTLDYRRLL